MHVSWNLHGPKTVRRTKRITPISFHHSNHSWLIHFMVNWWGKSGNSGRFFSVAEFFLGSKITVDGDCSHKIKRYLLLVRKAMTNTDNILKKRETSLCQQRQSYRFSSSHIWMCALKNWCLWTVVLEKTLESPLDCKEIRSVNPKGN